MPGHVVERAYVWDRFVRLHHWSLAALVLFDAFIFDGGGPWHRWAGYAALGLVGTRLVWGAIGSRYARFSGFFPTPARIRANPRVQGAYGHEALASPEAPGA